MTPAFWPLVRGARALGKEVRLVVDPASSSRPFASATISAPACLHARSERMGGSRPLPSVEVLAMNHLRRVHGVRGRRCGARLWWRRGRAGRAGLLRSGSVAGGRVLAEWHSRDTERADPISVGQIGLADREALEVEGARARVAAEQLAYRKPPGRLQRGQQRGEAAAGLSRGGSPNSLQ